MAYNTNEERLKVKGSEQITRDLKVNRDVFVTGNLEANKVDVTKVDAETVKASGDLDISGEGIFRDDVSISGDLFVNGTQHINDSETSQTSDDYMVLRHNRTTALGNGESSGLVVHNYYPNKTATLTTDRDGIWRVADNTETDTNYTDVSYYNNVYYEGLNQTTVVTPVTGIKTAFDEDELDEVAYYTTNSKYYHFDGTNWFEVSLVSNTLTIATTPESDATILADLALLNRYDLVYFRGLTITVINEDENEPLLTRDEANNLTDQHFLLWDAIDEKAVDSGMAPSSFATVATSGDYDDLTNKPNLATVATTGDYSDLNNKPNLATVATTGDYADLTNKPTIPTVTDSITDGDMSPVTSNAVYDALQNVQPGGGDVINAVDANGYWGMADPSKDDTVWIRTTTQGILPYQSGGSSAGHGSLGTSSWYFSKAYIQNMYGTLNGNATSATTATTANKIRTSAPSSPANGDIWIV